MKKAFSAGFFCMAIAACTTGKNLAENKPMKQRTDTVSSYINAASRDTETINPKLKQLQQENDLVISFASLNYAWARRGSFYVLAQKGKAWKAYRYDTKLPPSTEDAGMDITATETDAAEAERIKSLYTKAKLWQTEGDKGENFCKGKKDCNINDAETWAISIATKTTVHTTAYYAPEFFEECCPGNAYRKQFITIAKSVMNLVGNDNGGVEK